MSTLHRALFVVVPPLVLAAVLSLAIAHAQPANPQSGDPDRPRKSAACTTAQRFPHSIQQSCDDGTTQEVFFDQPGMVSVVSSTGIHAIAERDGPWLMFLDTFGGRCAVPQVLAQQLDFYPITCPPVPINVSG